MGNVYMEADQIRYKGQYRNVQEALDNAGGGGGTTVVANPEGAATADLSKLQVGETVYGIPADAEDIAYDNTTSGLTADDVQEAVDELNTGLSGVTELIPSDATSSNKLATADDIPGVATTSAPGIVQPDGTTITIADGVISAVGGSGSAPVYIGTNNLNKNDLTADSTNNRHTGVSSVISQSASMKAIIDSSALILCRLYIKSSDAAKTYLNSILLSPPGIEYNMYWADWKGFDYGIAAMSWASDKYSSYFSVKDGIYNALVSTDAIGVEYYKLA